MFRSAAVFAAWLTALTPAALVAQDFPPQQPPVRAIHLAGAREISARAILEPHNGADMNPGRASRQKRLLDQFTTLDSAARGLG